MQNFTDIPSSRTLSDSLAEILNNDKTAISCNSGTTFPTTNLQIGMLCYRSDQLKLYQLIGTNPDSWRFIMDLSTGIDAQFAAKLNAAAYTAADVLAKLLTVDGSGSGLDADMLDGQHASSFASAGHNHDAAYLGKTAKAADSELLDGFNSTAFLRAVNGVSPDANGNVAVNVDLSSRVTKTGDTMTGALTLPGMTVSSTAPTVDLADTSTGRTRKLHHNDDLMGFLKTDGNWDLYSNNNGQVWTPNYGWLHDYFFRDVANCGSGWGSGTNTGDISINCYGGGNVVGGTRVELLDEGGQIRLRSVNYLRNCNCDCQCYCFPAGTLVTTESGELRPIEKIVLGQRLASGLGSCAVVFGLHRVALGNRTAYRINGQVVTTGDHLFRTPDGWAALEPESYAETRFDAPSEVETARGLEIVSASAISPERVARLVLGSILLTSSGPCRVESIETLALPADTLLYSFVTSGAATFVADGFVVDGAPQEDC